MRPDRLNPLFQEVASLKGVGPAARRALEKLGVVRIRDLLFHLPSGWRHTRRIGALADAAEGERVALAVRVVSHEPGRGRAPYRVLAEDVRGAGLLLAFFGRHGPGLASRFPVGATLAVAGQLDLYQGRLQMAHPELAPAAGGDFAEAVYPLAAGLTSRRIAALVAEALPKLPAFAEWIEPGLLASRQWPSFGEALAAVHGGPQAGAARDRLAYDELLSSQLAWALVRARRRRKRGVPLPGDGRLTGALLESLPFRLTGAQAQAGAEIGGDLAGPHAMLRLLQGDVGAGKTVVALLALLTAVEAGAQGVLLAPTDLLARQHLATLERLTAGLPVRLGFLSGRDKGKARERLLARLANGEIDLLVGTHALFSADVRYPRLGLAVIDEQHRFGVAQRLLLTEKAAQPPHLLVMTATPIPRTLALANYGEMDISRLAERPPGRKPVDTRVVALARLDEVLDGVRRHLAAGRQAYWVCPLLAPSDEEVEGAPTPAVTRAEQLRQLFGDRVALVHGRLKASMRDREMERFQQGEAQLLVATTVIEVGVDVPNASLMVIESAERFGLAQLHQLRGRVGRGAERSVCLLLRGEGLSETARARLRMLRASEDGFAIAEADLKLRGAGELLGTRQSGEQGFQLASPEQVGQLLPLAHDDARLLTETDAELQTPRGQAARDLLYLFEQDAAVANLRGG